MSRVVSPTRHSAMSPRRWRASPMAGGSWRSPVQAWPRTIRPGGKASSTCSSAGRVVFSAAIDGSVYARHGTTIDTRLTVIDRVPAGDPTAFPASPGMASDAATLLACVTAQVPPRRPIAAQGTAATTARFLPARTRSISSARRVSVPATATEPTGIELAYETADWKPAEGGCITDALYEGYALQSIRIAGSQAHPTRLVQSAAMASVAPAEGVLPPASASFRGRPRSSVGRATGERDLCRRCPCRPSRRIVDC